MKIGLVRRGYSGTGGSEQYLRRFAEGAAAGGHSTVLFTTGDWPASAWSEELVRIPGRSPSSFANALEKAQPRRRCDLLFSFERVWSCDVYRAGDGVHAAWLARRANYEPSWRSFLRLCRAKHRALLQLERSVFSERGARFIIANSQMIKDEIEGYFRYPPGKIRVIYNGVPRIVEAVEASANRAAARNDLGVSEHEYIVLFAGSGWERKGLRFAIEAMDLVEGCDPTLLIAGTGNWKVRNRRAANVRFLGARDDMPRLLDAADVFLLPTLYDPFSNACLEALAAGLPVITTAHNGFAEVILPGKDGEVINDPGDVRAIARAIQRWASRELREEARPRLRALGTDFSIEKNVQQTLDALFSCVRSA